MSELCHYGVVLLAAGASRRLPGENKLLKPYRGKPLLSHALNVVSSLDFASVIVVTGFEAERIEALVRDASLRCVCNPCADHGMGTSIATGVGELPGGLAGAFIALGDMPLIGPDEYLCLVEAHQRCSQRICAPVYEGRRGHPVLFGADHFAALRSLGGDEGARSVLERECRNVVLAPAASQAIFMDLDEAGDFAGTG